MRACPSGTLLARSLMPMGVPGGSAWMYEARPFAVRDRLGCLDRWWPVISYRDVCRTLQC